MKNEDNMINNPPISSASMLKRLCVNGVTFVMIGVLLSVAIGLFSESTAPVFPVEKQCIHYFLDRQDQLEAITIGNSHNVAINYKTLGLNGFHLWTPAADMQEIHYTLHSFIDEIPNLRYIFLPLDYGFWGIDNGFDVKRNHMRLKVYALATPFNFFAWIDGDWKNRIKLLLSPIVRHDHWRGVFGKNLQNNKEQVTPDGARISPPVKPSRWNPSDKVENLPNFAANKHLRRFSKSMQQQPELKNISLAKLYDIISLTKSRGIKLILYTPPYSQQYTNTYLKRKPELIEETKRIIEHIRSQTAVTYLDYSTYEPISSNRNLFYDEDHLNDDGAILFSEVLASRLKLAP